MCLNNKVILIITPHVFNIFKNYLKAFALASHNTAVCPSFPQISFSFEMFPIFQLDAANRGSAGSCLQHFVIRQQCNKMDLNPQALELLMFLTVSFDNILRIASDVFSINS